MGGLSEHIRANKDEIIQAWSSIASRSHSALGVSRGDFNNLMRAYLASLASVSHGPEALGREQRDALESHLGSRLRLGFELGDIIDEFAILERCIIAVFASRRPGARLSASELMHLATGRQNAAAVIKSMFRRYALEDAQAEKGAVRRIQQVATRAMDHDALPFQAQLGTVAEIVLDATRAATTTIFLYDSAQRQKMIACASAGLVKEDVARTETDLGPHTLAGQVVRQEEQTVAILDVEITELDISDTLRHSGLHALLGARLPLRCDLTGIMYIAVPEIRPFETREKRRLETLAEHLALHLGAAQLHEALKARNADLQREKAMREQFVAVLAHDLRSPLTAARVAADRLVRAAGRQATNAELAQRVLNNIDRTDRMIHDLLDANRIEAGQGLPLQLQHCDLRAVADEVIDELEQAHGPRVLLTAEPRVEGVWSVDILRRALWNLVINALKYSTPGTPVTLRIDRFPDHVEVSVHNVGPPLAGTDLQALREPYQRALAAQASGIPGWGLGLTLVQGCAEAHGGRLNIASGSTGTTFSLVLPWDATHAGSPSPTAPAALH